MIKKCNYSSMTILNINNFIKIWKDIYIDRSGNTMKNIIVNGNVKNPYSIMRYKYFYTFYVFKEWQV